MMKMTKVLLPETTEMLELLQQFIYPITIISRKRQIKMLLPEHKPSISVHDLLERSPQDGRKGPP